MFISSVLMMIYHKEHTKMWFMTVCILSFALSARGGSCPPTLSVSECEAACGPSSPCAAPLLCCPTVCGGAICVEPMTQRRFTNLAKPGHCPESPGGPWLCSHSCTSDSDCPRKLKCCRNRCDALTCTKAEFPES